MRTAVSLYDVGELAGVSHMTASNVLNRAAHQRLVAPATASRVRQAAEQLGYIPNPVARSLALRKTQTIALVTNMHIGLAYVHNLMRPLQAALTARGYHLDIELTDKVRDEETLFRMLVGGRCDGVIGFGVTAKGIEILRAARRRGFPVVLHWTYEGNDLDTVEKDLAKGIRVATEHLLERGRKRVALVLFHSRDAQYADREKGYRQALQAAGIPFDPALLFPWRFGDDPRLLWDRIRALQPLPSGIVFYNNELAADALRFIRENGLRVPEDIAMVAHTDSPWHERLAVPLTAVDTDNEQTARALVERLWAQFENPRVKPRRVLIDPILIVRQSS